MSEESANRTHLKTAFGWTALAAALIVPTVIAARSPLLEWRDPVYIVAGLAGVVGLCLLLLQPLLADNLLPGLTLRRARSIHRSIGMTLVAVVIVHVATLWLTSPPDVVDALLLRSPTPFSLWGVLAMWAIFAAALLAAFRRRIRPRLWRIGHLLLAAVTVAGTAAHALLIEGTMGTISKASLCALALAATARVVITRIKHRR